jgi:hypothetical protein
VCMCGMCFSSARALQFERNCPTCRSFFLFLTINSKKCLLTKTLFFGNIAWKMEMQLGKYK